MRHSAGGKLQFAVELSNARSVEDLVRRLYAGIGGVFPSVVVGFDVLDPDTHRLLSSSAQGVSEFFLSRYDRVGRESDPVLNRAILSQNVAYNLAMMSEEEWRELRVYREAFSLHRMINLVYVPVIVGGKVFATLNLGRAEGGPAFTTEELAEASEVAALMSSLIESLQHRERLERELILFQAAFEMANEAVVISDVQSATRYVNRAAQRVLDGLPDDAPSFDEAVIAFQDRSQPRPEAQGFVQRVVPLREEDGMVTFLRGAAPVDELPEWLRRGLTGREGEVLILASKGLRDAEIAERLSLSIHTVKGYLREVFRKTGTRSRVELARLVADAS